MKLKYISWNVNGWRSVQRFGLTDWLKAERPDALCLQEIKVQTHQLPNELLHPKGYHGFWHQAERPGYSGVAILARREPLSVRYGLGVPELDREGRVLTLEFSNHILINSYFPNSQRDHARLPFKLKFCQAFLQHCQVERERGKTLVMCADWNIAPQDIDLANPKANLKNAGFLPEEREWIGKFLNAGYLDTFRHFNQDPGHYTWWSNRPGVRERNIGWRLDYFLMDQDSRSRLKASRHQIAVRGSDHCPITLEMKT